MPLVPYEWRRKVAWWLWRLFSPEHGSFSGEIRLNPGGKVDGDWHTDIDEVVGPGFLHVEQMDRNVYWARLDLPGGRSIAMWFRSKSKITLNAEWD
jgi:hypothetical protein